MVFINGKVSDVDGDFCTCVIRYRLLSDIPDELKDTIVVFQNQDADYIYQTITWFSPATRIRLSGVRTLMRTLHFCVRWTASLMKLRYSSCGARASAGRNWIQFLYRLAK